MGESRNFDWLKIHSLNQHSSRAVRAPFCIKGLSRTYAIASTNTYLVAIPLLPDEEPPFEVIENEHALRFIESGSPQAVTTASEIISWAYCLHCKGIDIERTCDFCKDASDECSECLGKKVLSCECQRRARPAMFADGIYINRTLVSNALKNLNLWLNRRVVVSWDPTIFVRMETDDWVVVVARTLANRSVPIPTRSDQLQLEPIDVLDALTTVGDREKST